MSDDLFGTLLERWLLRNHVSAEKLSIKSGFGSNTIRSWRKNISVPQPENFAMLLHTLRDLGEVSAEEEAQMQAAWERWRTAVRSGVPLSGSAAFSSTIVQRARIEVQQLRDAVARLERVLAEVGNE